MVPRISSDSELKPLPDSVKKLIEAKSYANFATLMRDGSPHVTQTWVDHEGDIVLINTPEGTQKHKNVMRDPRVALDIVDPGNPFNLAVVRGRVIEVTSEGAQEHIDRMAMKYQGKEKYEARQPGQRRVLIRIEPLHVKAPWGDDSQWKKWDRAAKQN
jgi:PPOX class probable F420-dependent enzyme